MSSPPPFAVPRLFPKTAWGSLCSAQGPTIPSPRAWGGSALTLPGGASPLSWTASRHCAAPELWPLELQQSRAETHILHQRTPPQAGGSLRLEGGAGSAPNQGGGRGPWSILRSAHSCFRQPFRRKGSGSRRQLSLLSGLCFPAGPAGSVDLSASGVGK